MNTQAINTDLYIKALKVQRDAALDGCAQLSAVNEGLIAKIEELSAVIIQLQQPSIPLQSDENMT